LKKASNFVSKKLYASSKERLAEIMLLEISIKLQFSSFYTMLSPPVLVVSCCVKLADIHRMKLHHI